MMINAAAKQSARTARGHAVRGRLREYARLMRLDRPIGVWLLLWPHFGRAWISANGHPDEHIFVIFLLGTFVMRAAGCVINDFADREFDPHVRRTANRPLARQAVSPAEALALFAVLGLIALALLIPLNRPTQVLALIGGVLAITYPFLKRFFALPQAYLASLFRGLRADGVCGARRARCHWWRGCCSSPACCGRRRTTRSTPWSIARTISVIGVRSSAILFGRADRGIVAMLQVGALALLVLAGYLTHLGRWYWLGVGLAAVLSAHQQYLIRRRDPAECFRAFLNNNLVGLAVFGGILLDYLFRR